MKTAEYLSWAVVSEVMQNDLSPVATRQLQ